MRNDSLTPSLRLRRIYSIIRASKADILILDSLEHLFPAGKVEHKIQLKRIELPMKSLEVSFSTISGLNFNL